MLVGGGWYAYDRLDASDKVAREKSKREKRAMDRQADQEKAQFLGAATSERTISVTLRDVLRVEGSLIVIKDKLGNVILQQHALPKAAPCHVTCSYTGLRVGFLSKADNNNDSPPHIDLTLTAFSEDECAKLIVLTGPIVSRIIDGH